jgi:flagellar biosynthesis protein FlhB
MAEQDQDRHLPATERKIRKAREEGQVARSRDLSHVVVLGLGSAVLVGGAASLSNWLQHLFAAALRFDAPAMAKPEQMVDRLAFFSWPTVALILAVGSVLLAGAVAGTLLSGGWNFSTKAMAPTWEKISPWAGLKRMFGLQQLGTMGKASLLALVVGLVGVLYVQQHMQQFANLLGMPIQAGLAEGAAIVGGGLLMMLLPLAAFAIVDVPLQRHFLLKRLRMSHEEVKKEHKDVDGNAQVKGRMRARMREMANRRMMAAVPTADLVVMNPTHYAVALKYDEGQMSAPRVVAKGLDLVALRIRDLAREAGVPVLEAPPLARALYAHTELDREVPSQLFAAVAQVLAWVFQLRHAGVDRRTLLNAPPQPEVPPELDPQYTEPAPAVAEAMSATPAQNTKNTP